MKVSRDRAWRRLQNEKAIDKNEIPFTIATYGKGYIEALTELKRSIK